MVDPIMTLGLALKINPFKSLIWRAISLDQINEVIQTVFLSYKKILATASVIPHAVFEAQ